MSEIAVFIDDNQFGLNQSTMKCGPEVVSLFWHSVAPGQKNPYTSADVHAMAHADYVRFIGADNPGDMAGTSEATLYQMLEFHSFRYEKLPIDLAAILSALKAGFPVIVGGVAESSVFDVTLGKNPYNWNTAGLYHIILATGIAQSGNLLVRDTANIGSQGIVRPGPREYEASRLQFTTVTRVVPSWDVKAPVDWRTLAEGHLKLLTEDIGHW